MYNLGFAFSPSPYIVQKFFTSLYFFFYSLQLFFCLGRNLEFVFIFTCFQPRTFFFFHPYVLYPCPTQLDFFWHTHKNNPYISIYLPPPTQGAPFLPSCHLLLKKHHLSFICNTAVAPFHFTSSPTRKNPQQCHQT